MRNSYITVIHFSALVFGLVLSPANASAQEKSKVQKALSYKPVQRTIDYDIPEKSEFKSCRLSKTMEKFKKPGFVVYDASGRMLRLFFDINRDNALDSWSYFKDGIEVYRDVDTDFDGRADEFNWMGSAGTRRGKDTDKNGTVDAWEKLSASELAEEVFHAIRTADSARFKKLLATPSDLKSMGIGGSSAPALAGIEDASKNFEKFAKTQKAISSRSKWTQFGSTRPGLVPKGQEGLKNDVLIYDHAAAVFDNAGKFGQISLGTIVEISPNNWRALELPQLVGEGQVVANGGLFYPAPVDINSDEQFAGNTDRPGTKKMIKLFEEYDAVEKQLLKTTKAAEVARIQEKRAELLMQLALTSSEKEEKRNWIRQMADTVTTAYQNEEYSDGTAFLEKQIPRIKSDGMASEIPYVKWRIIYSRFYLGHSIGDRTSRRKANERYLSDLEQFAEDYPKDSLTAEALFQLGMNSDFTDREDLDNAVKWYKKCKSSFPNTLFGKKAAGALTRLTSQGKPFPISGSTIGGQRLNISQYKGKVVVIHYWETGCDTCIDNFEELQRLGAKYKDKIRVVGVNLDADSSQVKKFLSQNRSVNWPQLHSPGGVDKSPLAVQMGINMLPINILVDGRGNMVESNIPADVLDREIQRTLRRQTGQANRSRSTR